MNAQSIQLNVPLNFNQLMGLVNQLSISDKLRLEGMLWNETDESHVEISAIQQKIVSERLQKMNENPRYSKSWEEIERNTKL